MESFAAGVRVRVDWDNEVLTDLWKGFERGVVERAHQTDLGLHDWLNTARAWYHRLSLHYDAWTRFPALSLPILVAVPLALLMCYRVVLDTGAVLLENLLHRVV